MMKNTVVKDKYGNKLQVGDLVKRNGIKYRVVQVYPNLGIMPVPEIKFLKSGSSLEIAGQY